MFLVKIASEGTSLKLDNLLMAIMVWKILVPQIYVEFHGWKTVDVQEKYC